MQHSRDRTSSLLDKADARLNSVSGSEPHGDPSWRPDTSWRPTVHATATADAEHPSREDIHAYRLQLDARQRAWAQPARPPPPGPPPAPDQLAAAASPSCLAAHELLDCAFRGDLVGALKELERVQAAGGRSAAAAVCDTLCRWTPKPVPTPPASGATPWLAYTGNSMGEGHASGLVPSQSISPNQPAAPLYGTAGAAPEVPKPAAPGPSVITIVSAIPEGTAAVSANAAFPGLPYGRDALSHLRSHDYLRHGCTPLSVAAALGHLDIVRLLLEYGAAPDAPSIPMPRPAAAAPQPAAPGPYGGAGSRRRDGTHSAAPSDPCPHVKTGDSAAGPAGATSVWPPGAPRCWVSPLAAAALWGDLAVVTALLRGGADPTGISWLDDGAIAFTALHVTPSWRVAEALMAAAAAAAGGKAAAAAPPPALAPAGGAGAGTGVVAAAVVQESPGAAARGFQRATAREVPSQRPSRSTSIRMEARVHPQPQSWQQRSQSQSVPQPGLQPMPQTASQSHTPTQIELGVTRDAGEGEDMQGQEQLGGGGSGPGRTSVAGASGGRSPRANDGGAAAAAAAAASAGALPLDPWLIEPESVVDATGSGEISSVYAAEAQSAPDADAPPPPPTDVAALFARSVLGVPGCKSALMARNPSCLLLAALMEERTSADAAWLEQHQWPPPPLATRGSPGSRRDEGPLEAVSEQPQGGAAAAEADARANEGDAAAEAAVPPPAPAVLLQPPCMDNPSISKTYSSAWGSLRLLAASNSLVRELSRDTTPYLPYTLAPPHPPQQPATPPRQQQQEQKQAQPPHGSNLACPWISRYGNDLTRLWRHVWLVHAVHPRLAACWVNLIGGDLGVLPTPPPMPPRAEAASSAAAADAASCSHLRAASKTTTKDGVGAAAARDGGAAAAATPFMNPKYIPPDILGGRRGPAAATPSHAFEPTASGLPRDLSYIYSAACPASPPPPPPQWNDYLTLQLLEALQHLATTAAIMQLTVDSCTLVRQAVCSEPLASVPVQQASADIDTSSGWRATSSRNVEDGIPAGVVLEQEPRPGVPAAGRLTHGSVSRGDAAWEADRDEQQAEMQYASLREVVLGGLRMLTLTGAAARNLPKAHLYGSKWFGDCTEAWLQRVLGRLCVRDEGRVTNGGGGGSCWLSGGARVAAPWRRHSRICWPYIDPWVTFQDVYHDAYVPSCFVPSPPAPVLSSASWLERRARAMPEAAWPAFAAAFYGTPVDVAAACRTFAQGLSKLASAAIAVVPTDTTASGTNSRQTTGCSALGSGLVRHRRKQTGSSVQMDAAWRFILDVGLPWLFVQTESMEPPLSDTSSLAGGGGGAGGGVDSRLVAVPSMTNGGPACQRDASRLEKSGKSRSRSQVPTRGSVTWLLTRGSAVAGRSGSECLNDDDDDDLDTLSELQKPPPYRYPPRYPSRYASQPPPQPPPQQQQPQQQQQQQQPPPPSNAVPSGGSLQGWLQVVDEMLESMNSIASHIDVDLAGDLVKLISTHLGGRGYGGLRAHGAGRAARHTAAAPTPAGGTAATAASEPATPDRRLGSSPQLQRGHDRDRRAHHAGNRDPLPLLLAAAVAATAAPVYGDFQLNHHLRGDAAAARTCPQLQPRALRSVLTSLSRLLEERCAQGAAVLQITAGASAAAVETAAAATAAAATARSDVVAALLAASFDRWEDLLVSRRGACPPRLGTRISLQVQLTALLTAAAPLYPHLHPELVALLCRSVLEVGPDSALMRRSITALAHRLRVVRPGCSPQVQVLVESLLRHRPRHAAVLLIETGLGWPRVLEDEGGRGGGGGGSSGGGSGGTAAAAWGSGLRVTTLPALKTTLVSDFTAPPSRLLKSHSVEGLTPIVLRLSDLRVVGFGAEAGGAGAAGDAAAAARGRGRGGGGGGDTVNSDAGLASPAAAGAGRAGQPPASRRGGAAPVFGQAAERPLFSLPSFNLLPGFSSIVSTADPEPRDGGGGGPTGSLQRSSYGVGADGDDGGGFGSDGGAVGYDIAARVYAAAVATDAALSALGGSSGYSVRRRLDLLTRCEGLLTLAHTVFVAVLYPSTMSGIEPTPSDEFEEFDVDSPTAIAGGRRHRGSSRRRRGRNAPDDRGGGGGGNGSSWWPRWPRFLLAMTGAVLGLATGDLAMLHVTLKRSFRIRRLAAGAVFTQGWTGAGLPVAALYYTLGAATAGAAVVTAVSGVVAGCCVRLATLISLRLFRRGDGGSGGGGGIWQRMKSWLALLPTFLREEPPVEVDERFAYPAVLRMPLLPGITTTLVPHYTDLLEALLYDKTVPPELWRAPPMMVLVLHIWRRFTRHVIFVMFMNRLLYTALFTAYALSLGNSLVEDGEAPPPACTGGGPRASQHGLLIALGLMVAENVVVEARQLVEEGFFNWVLQPWNVCDLVDAGLMSCIVGLHLSCACSLDLLCALAQVQMLVLFWRLMYYAMGLRHLGSFVRMVLEVTYDLRVFFVFLAVVYCGFALAIIVVVPSTFHVEGMEVERVKFVFVRLYAMLFGDFNYGILLDPGAGYLSLSYMTSTISAIYMLFVSIILLNILIAIVGDAYDRVRGNDIVNDMRSKAAMIVEVDRLMPRWLRQKRDEQLLYCDALVVLQREDEAPSGDPGGPMGQSPGAGWYELDGGGGDDNDKLFTCHSVTAATAGSSSTRGNLQDRTRSHEDFGVSEQPGFGGNASGMGPLEAWTAATETISSGWQGRLGAIVKAIEMGTVSTCRTVAVMFARQQQHQQRRAQELVQRAGEEAARRAAAVAAAAASRQLRAAGDGGGGGSAEVAAVIRSEVAKQMKELLSGMKLQLRAESAQLQEGVSASLQALATRLEGQLAAGGAAGGRPAEKRPGGGADAAA